MKQYNTYNEHKINLNIDFLVTTNCGCFLSNTYLQTIGTSFPTIGTQGIFCTESLNDFIRARRALGSTARRQRIFWHQWKSGSFFISPWGSLRAPPSPLNKSKTSVISGRATNQIAQNRMA